MKQRFAKIHAFYRRGSKLQRFVKYFFTILILLVFLTAGAAEFTSRPQFCPTCHYMESFYQSWQASKHNHISCVKCHFDPGIAGTVRGKLEGLVQVVKYVSQSYRKSKPWAEISDKSCLQSGCHETRLMEGDVLFKGVHFNHRPHLTQMRRGKKLRCTSCHSQIVQGDHIAVTSGTCFTCHFKPDPDIHLAEDSRTPAKLEEIATHRAELKKMADCKTCHRWDLMDAKQRASYRFDHTEVLEQKQECTQCHTNTVIGNGGVPKENCYKCHFEQARLQKYSQTGFLHEQHITKNKIECQFCHIPIQHKIQVLDAKSSLDCNSCHPKSHQAQLELYTGSGGVDVPESPSPMFTAGLNCRGCHLFHESNAKNNVETYRAGKNSCERCHGTGYSRLLEEWSNASTKQIDQLAQMMQEVEAAVGRSRRPGTAEALANAKKNIELVRHGKSVHNIRFSDALLTAAYAELKKAIAAAHSPMRLPALKSIAGKIPSECAACHTGITNVTVDIFGMKYNHGNHVNDRDVKCVRCHSNQRKHGELIVRKSDCNACHHASVTGKEEQCRSCHTLQASVYTGTIVQPAAPSMKSGAGVECTACHLDEAKKVLLPDGNTCKKCHDEGYREILATWQADVRKGVEEVQKRLALLAPQALSEEEKRSVGKAREVLEQVAADGSSGAHNPDLFTSQLEKQRKSLDALIGARKGTK